MMPMSTHPDISIISRLDKNLSNGSQHEYNDDNAQNSNCLNGLDSLELKELDKAKAIQPTYLTRHFIKTINDQCQTSSNGKYGNNANDVNEQKQQIMEQFKNKNKRKYIAKKKAIRLGIKEDAIVFNNNVSVPRKRGRPRKLLEPLKKSSENHVAIFNNETRIEDDVTHIQQQTQQKSTHGINKADLDATRFAQTNPLIMLCEVARREQQHVERTQVQQQKLQSQVTNCKFGQSENPLIGEASSSQYGNCSSALTGSELALGSTQYQLHQFPTASSSCCSSKDYHLSNGILLDEHFKTYTRQQKKKADVNYLLHNKNSCLVNNGESSNNACPTSIDENAYRCRLRLMTTKEAQNHLLFACTKAISENIPLSEMMITNGSRFDMIFRNDLYEFKIPDACLNILSPSSIEALSRIIYQWIDGWIRTKDDFTGKQMRNFSLLMQMRWVLVYAIPELCIFYLKKRDKISTEAAIKIFLTST